MPNKIDLTGQRFGKLVVIAEASKEQRSGGRVSWICQCDCGKQKITTSDRLRRGIVTHCGCGNIKNIAGQRYGKLTAVKPTDMRSGTNVVWECLCDCGNTTFTSVDHLRAGDAKSCGCLKKETRPEVMNRLVGQRFGKLVVQKSMPERNKHGGIMWECLCDCGNNIIVSSNHLNTGNTQSCGCLLGQSVGELNIAQLLTENNIKFQQEYTFKDLPNRRYDFAIFNNNHEIIQLIEFDGEQHYKTCIFFNSTLEQQQAIDKEKNEFAQQKGIKLVRIPYTKRNNITLNDLQMEKNDDYTGKN